MAKRKRRRSDRVPEKDWDAYNERTRLIEQRIEELGRIIRERELAARSSS